MRQLLLNVCKLSVQRVNDLELYCTLTIEVWLKLNMNFDYRYMYLELWIFGLVYIVLDVRDGMESKCPSIVFLSIVESLNAMANFYQKNTIQNTHTFM